ncbi:Lon protease, mitochondrial [Sphaceloma murrayae]|uniref:Lon protease homolog, mitochondrial n=1 Tax=Sphaceloma murrayae TaxID=2082308 RepID=A0A2K1QMF9_9PEZI|nr:Lon protease, mitochondrial [Sphaceloma murrayae]
MIVNAWMKYQLRGYEYVEGQLDPFLVSPTSSCSSNIRLERRWREQWISSPTRKHSSRSTSILGQRRNDVTSAPRSTPDNRTPPNNVSGNISIASLWGTSWSAIQGIANDLLGEQGAPQQQQRTHRRKNSNAVPPGKLLVRPAVPSWGPSNSSIATPSSYIATGSREEREALVRAQKRKDLLSGASSSYPDSLGKFKRRTSDEGISASAPPGANEDRDALVYLHNVRPEDTLAGITIRYGCSANVLRKANRMWPNDNVQVKKILTLPVDACTVKGKRVSESEADLLFEPDQKQTDTSDLPTPKANGATAHKRTDSTTSSLSERPPPSVRSSNAESEPPWTHDSWVMLPNAVKPTEIARLPRKTLGYFPPARRKSQSYSDRDTPSTSLDINRQAYFDNPSPNAMASMSPLRADAPQRPRRPRRTSNASNGYFPSYLSGPGGVGTMARDVRSPGPAQDSLNKFFAAKLPNVAPPPNQQNLYLPDIPTYSDNPSRASSPYPGGSGLGSGTLTPNTAQGLENVGAAIEGWMRKMASRAQSARDQSDGAAGAKLGVPPIGGPSGIGDLIEMADSFEIGGDEDDDKEEEERGRRGEGPSAEGSGRFVGEGPLAARRAASQLQLSTSRTFSSSASRRKEKPPPGADKNGGEEVEKADRESADPVKSDAEGITAKSRSSDPAPIPPPDGKGATAGGAGGESGSSGGDGSGRGRKKSEKGLTKPQVPDVYPQVMAIPIAQRPLFPGFYKAITIRDPNVIGAVNELVKRGQSYVGAFLLKDPESSKDVIDSPDEVYDVGTFCQITGAFSAGHGEDKALQAVLYPHRRIKLTELIPPNRTEAATFGDGEKVATATIVDQTKSTAQKTETKDGGSSDKQGDVVASFEEQAAEAQQQQQPKEVGQYEPTSFLRSWPVSLVKTENLVDEPVDKSSATIRAFVSEIVNTCKEIANVNPLFRDHVSAFAMSQTAANIADDPAKLADFAAAISGGEMEEAQEVLASLNIEERLRRALTVIKREHMNAQLSSKISKDVESKIQKRQREYWLMEQMKGIKRELGLESDGKDKMVEKFKERASKLAMPEAVRKVFDEELNKLAHLEPAASEFNVTRNYLDWLTQIPWGQRSAENFGIKNAMTVLDEDHHGLKDVKDRILEFIAVGKLRGTVEGKILCMVGPPGVGKTSIGKSIARALNRQYYRFSVGGLTDVAEIKGHRRTYVGALPGRIIQALKKCQTENPLILIDEVDKIGRGHQGDPSSALLELLDPEQNNSFLDHYMDVPVDLSKVLFVCTANMTDTIPRPLLDRMEMIELSGYVADEKMAIAERYLAPAAKELSGLKDANVNLEKEAIAELINKYCRESGVRNLKKQIEKVYRKAALKIVQDLGEEVLPEEKALTEEGKAAQEEANKSDTDVKETPSESQMEKETTETPRVALQVPDSVQVSIDKDNLKDYVGPPVFTADRLYETTPPGVAMGLAWTQMGGAALYIETIIENALNYNSRPGFERTGNLRPVMKESTQIAYSFAKGLMARTFPENKFFDKARIHLHCPEGAVQKDGPSAGITMATSLLSLALDKPLDPTIAMTGELTVTGKVLRIGGLREKTVAARRAGAKMVVFPKDNTSDWLELPQNIKEGIEGKPVEWYQQVFELMFPGLDKAEANAVWKKQLQKPPKEERDEEGDAVAN